jgi:hypothetical protein
MSNGCWEVLHSTVSQLIPTLPIEHSRYSNSLILLFQGQRTYSLKTQISFPVLLPCIWNYCLSRRKTLRQRGWKRYTNLVQLIERVHLCVIQNETLQRVLGFATVGSRSWIFIVQRDYSKLDTLSGKLHETFVLYPIEAASILPIWHAFNRLAKANSQVYVQPVAFTLAQLLAVLGYHAGYCSIQYETNRSNVFTIKIHSAYDNYHHNRHKVYFSTPAASCQNSFVIKFTEGLSPSLLRRATNELEVLNNLKGSLAANYVIATVSTSSSVGLAINEFDTSSSRIII